MTFTPEQLEQVAAKQRGDAIRSSDWNIVVDEVQDLGETKVNRSGDTITGSLTVENNSTTLLSVGRTENTAALTVLPNGRVGIGTATPRDTLAIRATGRQESLISFEDPQGRTRWHLEQNLGGNRPGLNFVETGVADGRLFIAAGNNVGIGTTQPNARLEVVDSSSSGNNENILALRYSNRPRTSLVGGNRFIDFLVRNESVGHIQGLGTESGNFLFFAGTSRDYAEYLPRLKDDEVIEPGEVVGVFGGKVTKVTENAHQVMAITDRPIVLGNMPAKGQEHLYEKVSFIGQIPIKVRGSVQAGDYIIPSGLNDGTGIAVAPQDITPIQCGQIVGRAWESSDEVEVKRVNAAVGLDNSSAVATSLMSEMEDLKAELQELKREKSLV
jgi:hypothetical protein